MTQKNKVIGVGFHKTGTTTLGQALQLLGYNHISYSREAFLLYHASEISAVLTLMDYFDSFDDWPWPLLYQEIYERFPESKFILTKRSNEERWFASLAKHVSRGPNEPFKFRTYIYGYDHPEENKQAHIEKYVQHNQAVRAFFADKKASFLEVCWEKGDGWDEICSFLDLPLPNLPFPHSNQQPGQRPIVRRVFGRIGLALRVLCKGNIA